MFFSIFINYLNIPLPGGLTGCGRHNKGRPADRTAFYHLLSVRPDQLPHKLPPDPEPVCSVSSVSPEGPEGLTEEPSTGSP